MHFYRNGEAWHLQDDAVIATATDEQARRREVDAWEERIVEWLGKKDRVTITEIFIQALDLPPHMQRKVEQMRVGLILKNLGLKRGPRTGGKQYWIRDNL